MSFSPIVPITASPWRLGAPCSNVCLGNNNTSCKPGATGPSGSRATGATGPRGGSGATGNRKMVYRIHSQGTPSTQVPPDQGRLVPVEALDRQAVPVQQVQSIRPIKHADVHHHARYDKGASGASGLVGATGASGAGSISGFGFDAQKTMPQTVPSGTSQTVAFQATLLNDGLVYNAGTSTFTTPPLANGRYRLDALFPIQLDNSGSLTPSVFIGEAWLQAGVLQAGRQVLQYVVPAGETLITEVVVSSTLALAPGTTVTVQLNNTSLGNSITVPGNVPPGLPVATFSGYLVYIL